MVTKLDSRDTFRIWHQLRFLRYTLPWLVHNWSRPDHTELGFQRRGPHSAPYLRFNNLTMLVFKLSIMRSGVVYLIAP